MNKTPSKLMPLLCNMFGMSTKCKKKTVKFAKFTDVYLIHTIDEIKTEVKRKAGLFTITETSSYDYKSFRECSKNELSKAIETCLEIGHMLGYYMD